MDPAQAPHPGEGLDGPEDGHGAPLDATAAWENYRGLSFHTLMTIVVSIGFGALNSDQDALMAEILNRSVAALDRLDYPAWLEALPKP